MAKLQSGTRIYGTANVDSTLTVGNILVLGNSGTLNANSTFSNTYTESATASSISASTLTLNLATSGVFYVNLNSNITTITIQNPPAANTSGGFVLVFIADGTQRSITWPASFKWPLNTPPSLSSTNGLKDAFTFFTYDGGTTWNAFITGQAI